MAELAGMAADKIESGTAVRLEGGPDGICLVRIGEEFFALADKCSHANVSPVRG